MLILSLVISLKKARNGEDIRHLKGVTEEYEAVIDWSGKVGQESFEGSYKFSG